MALTKWDRPSLLSKDHPLYLWIILQNVILPVMIAIFSTVATVVLATSIRGGLAIDGSLDPWVTTIYLLGSNSSVPIANWFADKYGYKRMYFLSILIFTLGTSLSALAGNFWILALGRAVEGIGAGLIFPIGMAILAQNFPSKKLNLAINLYMGIGFGLGIAAGLLVSGYLGMHTIWRWAFFITIPNGIIALIIVWLFFEETKRKKVPPFDLRGFSSFVLCIASLLIALANGNLKSTAEGWRSPFILLCFLLAILGLILTIWFEMRAEHPFIPLSLFKDPLFSVGCVTLFTIGISLFGSATLIVTYMEEGLFYDKFRIGIVSMSYGIAIGLFSILANILIKKISASLLSIMGLTIIIISYFLNNLLSFQSGKVIINIIMILRGMGIGLALGPITAQTLKNVSRELSSDAASILTFFRQIGATYGGSVLGIIVIRRRIFHDQRFAEPVNADLSGFEYNFQMLKNHLINTFGSSYENAEKQAKHLIIQNIKVQSLIQAINDALIAFAYATIAVSILLIIFNIKNILVYNKNSLTID